MKQKRDLLVILGRLPCPPYTGLTVRYAYFLEGLASHWRLWVVAFADLKQGQRKESGIAAMQPFCHRLEVVDLPPEPTGWRRYLSLVLSRKPCHNVLPYYTREFRERLRRLLRTIRPDVALLLYLPVADYRYEVPAGVPVVLDHPDAFSPAFFQAAAQSYGWHRRCFALLDTWKLKAFQRRAAKECDLNIVVSEEDKRLLLSLCPTAQVTALPTGVDLAQYAPGSSEGEKDGIDVLLTGVFTYSANIEAACYLCEEIMPLVWRKRPKTTVMLVGMQFAERVRQLATERVRLVENVPDIRPYYQSAKVFVAPYRFVFGIRYKILEAMAMGKPIVGTSAAFLGIPAQDGVGCLIRDDPTEFADALLWLLEDAGKRQSLGEQARAFVAEHFDRHRIVARLNERLEGIAR